MVKQFIAVVLAVLVMVPALARADGEEGGQGGNFNRNENVNKSANVNKSDNVNKNANVNKSDNVNSAVSSSSAHQRQKQSQFSKNASSQANAQTTNVDAHSDTDVPRMAPPAIAPNLTAVPETCMGSAAVGASTPFGGVSFGSTYKSDDCELRMYARALMALGQNEAALALLAGNANVAAALKKVGYKASWLDGGGGLVAAKHSVTLSPSAVYSVNFSVERSNP